MDIFLWNQSPENLKDSEGQLIADACDLQMQGDVARAYGLQPSPRVSFVPFADNPAGIPGDCLVIIFAKDHRRSRSCCCSLCRHSDRRTDYPRCLPPT